MSEFLNRLREVSKIYRCKKCGKITKKRVNCMNCGSFEFELINVEKGEEQK